MTQPNAGPTDPTAMPDEAIAFVDGFLALSLFLLPVSIVGGLFEGGALGELERGMLSMAIGFGCVILYGLVRMRRLSLRSATGVGLGWSLGRYGMFMIAWLPVAFWLYPKVMEWMEVSLPPQKMLEYLAAGPQDGWFWVALITACVGAPIAEEILFRGFLFRAIESAASQTVALILTTIVFALLHEPSVMLPILLLGGLFGYLRIKSGGIAASILVHMVHNSWTIAAAVLAPQTLDLVFDK